MSASSEFEPHPSRSGSVFGLSFALPTFLAQTLLVRPDLGSVLQGGRSRSLSFRGFAPG